jgi:hypothetical protein
MIERELMAMRALGDATVCLVSSVDPADHLNGSGSVLVVPAPGAGVMEESLAAADTLADLWVAADGTMWACSGGGRIWTTAAVAPAAAADIPAHQVSGALRWTCQTVPPLTAQGYAPSFTGIWGAGAGSMVAISFEGAVYGWNGADWSEAALLDLGPLSAVGGRSMGDFLVGADHGALIRFRGGQRVAIALEGGGRVTGIAEFDGELWVLDDAGRLHVINDDDTSEVAVEVEAAANGLCACADALYICSAEGLWRMDGEELENCVASNLFALCFAGPRGPVFIPWESAEQLYFVEGRFPQEGEPGFTRFDLPVRAVSE